MTAVEKPGTRPPAYPLPRHGLELDPEYAQVRDRCPVSRVEMPYGGATWLVSGHDEVCAVLTDSRFSRSAATTTSVPRRLPEAPPPGSIFGMDGAEHQRLRRLVSKAFTARRIEALRPRVAAITEDLVDAMVDRGSPADLVESLAVPLPVTVICELMGVGSEHREQFRAFTDTLLTTTSFGDEAVQSAFADFAALFAGIIEDRRRHLTDDLLGGLVSARDGQNPPLSEDELVLLGVALLIGGHETTLNQISNFVFTLCTRPALKEQLLADPQLIGAAVEELLRVTPLDVGSAYAFVATERVVVGDVLIEAGDSAIVDLAVADRDGRVFPRPEEIDVNRRVNPHLAFGHGPHYCIGAQLARLELHAALATLLRRCPDLTLALPAAQVRFREGSLLRGPTALPVRW